MKGPKVVQGPHRAIFTEYRGPTDYKGSRLVVVVAGSGKRFTISWNYALGVTENHDAAALEACKRMGWTPTPGDPPGTKYPSKLYGASLAGGGYVYVLV